MATKATSKRSSGNASRRKKGRSPISGKLVLYPLSVVAGLYLGVQAYAKFLSPNDGTPVKKRAAQPEAPGKAVTEKPRNTAAERKPDEAPKAGDTASKAAGEPSEMPEEAPKVTIRSSAPVEKMPGIEIDRATTGRPEVALTLDAGADWRPVRQILDTLQKEGVRCTFFLTGEWVKENPRTTQRISTEGHEIGNHSWDHPAFTGLSAEQIKDQLDRTEAIIQETTGKSSRPYFRPPLGARDDRVRRTVGENGFLSVYWTLDSHDSVQKGITASQIKERVLGGIAPGSIVLLHCGSQATADALPEILAGLKERNLKPVLLSQLLTK